MSVPLQLSDPTISPFVPPPVCSAGSCVNGSPRDREFPAPNLQLLFRIISQVHRMNDVEEQPGDSDGVTAVVIPVRM
ncbi:MAG: hypothetical protein JO166_02605 [Deltaproteobacteria bacterium]|nr:hypothetical protein [Deltaproteobacteria bacterium]